ncbi:MAG: PD-(D/E)XK nuclease family protein [Lachnospiraceae bacterium]|nr:PD-(D/E)XK nuclease family protein [Lachnospiraceae bacterium]
MDWLEKKGDKLLLCENIKEANRWMRRINKTSKIYTQGVTACTISDLAKNIVEMAVAFSTSLDELREVKVLDDAAASRIMLEVLQDRNVRAECEGKGVTFIPEASIDNALALKIIQAFHKLRLGERKAESDSAGREDGYRRLLGILLEKYEDKLKDAGYYDRCMILKKAIECLENAEYIKDYQAQYSRMDVACLMPWERTYEENRFLKKIESISSVQEMTMIDMRVFDKGKKVSYEFVKAYGAANEIRHIADEIEGQKIPYGDVTVLYSSQEHDSFIRTVFGERGIPYCMPAGRLALDNDYIDLLYRLLDWMQTGGFQSAEGFLKRSGCLSLWEEADEETGQSEEVKQNEGEKQSAEPKQNKKKGRSLLPEALRDIRDIHQKFSTGGEVTFYSLLKELEDYLKKYSHVPNPNWKTAKECINSIYDRYEGAAPVSFKDAAARLQEELTTIRTAEEERQDAVCVIPIQKRSVLERGHNYIVGLSDYHFRETLLDSAILSDEQLKNQVKVDASYSADDRDKDYVELELDAERRKQEHLTDTMNTLFEGRIVLSYSSYDSVNQKKISPSLYYLDIMKEKEGKEKPVGGYSLLSYNYVDDAALFPNTAEDNQEEDGAGSAKVPVFSQSALYTMLVCSRKYFYKKVLHIPDEEEKDRNAGIWLEPLVKGTLFHSVLEKYINSELKDVEIPAGELNQVVFDRIFSETIEGTREEVPCESEVVYEMEKQSYQEILERFLTELHIELSKSEQKWKVYQCEMKIGLNEKRKHRPEDEYREEYEFEYEDEPGEVHKEKLTVAYHGELDRVDFYVDSKGITHFRIVDYKTGKQNSHKQKLDCDIWPQHIIYARLLENKVKDCVVDEFVYEYLFEKAPEKRKIVYTKEQLEGLPVYVKEVLIRTLAKHDYAWRPPINRDKTDKEEAKKVDGILKEHEKTCEYCSYQDMCRERMGRKL